MESELLLAWIILGFACAAVVSAFLLWRVVEMQVDNKSAEFIVNGIPPPPRAYAGGWPAELKWLSTLTSLTAALLVVQILLGYFTGALVVVADAAHGAADLASYFLAAFLEYMKYHFGKKAVGVNMSYRIDRFSACFSVLVVFTNSAVVAIEAALQLKDGNAHGEESSLGAVMMIVAFLGLALNATLLFAHFWIKRGGDGSAEADGPAPPPPVPVAASAATGVRVAVDGREAQRQARRMNRKKKERCLPTFSMHAAFHPGCQDGNCDAEKMSSGEQPNLNVYGVILHVGTDVARTMLMLIVGLLVQCKVLGSNFVKVDAYCAFAICCCVVLGSAWLLGAALGMNGGEEYRDQVDQDQLGKPKIVYYGAAAVSRNV